MRSAERGELITVAVAVRAQGTPMPSMLIFRENVFVITSYEMVHQDL
jgi:hypothetical protein